jgi:hypothetical protein
MAEVRWGTGRRYRLWAVAQIRLVMDETRHSVRSRETAGRRSKRDRTKGACSQAASPDTGRVLWNCERLLRGDTEGSAYTQAGAAGELGEVLAAVGVHSKAATNYYFVGKFLWAPRKTSSRFKNPLPAGQG